MSVTFTAVKCPECGASLPIEEGRKQIFCSYCGSNVIVTNENEYIYRRIDEASIQQAETDRLVRLRKLAIEEKKSSTKRILIIIWLIVVVILLTIGIILMNSHEGLAGIYLVLFAFMFTMIGLIVASNLSNGEKTASDGRIRFPEGMEPFTDEDYEDVYNSLRRAGFTNVSCQNKHDLTFGIFRRQGSVAEILVDGERITSGGEMYMPNVPITIVYHGK